MARRTVEAVRVAPILDGASQPCVFPSDEDWGAPTTPVTNTSAMNTPAIDILRLMTSLLGYERLLGRSRRAKAIEDESFEEAAQSACRVSGWVI
ncbi:MAG: hypothetical protein ABJA98_12505 [Acidobacteriota bacterium]